jgi:hypothetical protein
VDLETYANHVDVTPTEVVSDAAPVYPEVRVTGNHLAGPPANVLVRIRSNRAIK